VLGVLVLAAAVLTVWAHLRWRAGGPRALRFDLALFASAALLETLLLALSRPPSAPPATPWIVVAAAVGLVTWFAMANLVARETRARDLWFRIPVLLLAAFVLIGGSWRASLLLASFAILSYRWKIRIETVRLFQLGAVAMGLSAVLLTAPTPSLASLKGWPHAVAAFALVTAKAAGAYAAYGSLVLWAAFVRDPTLGIRRVSWRLALSHLLVVLVPLVLVAAMWASTTVLGVNQERAHVGARSLERESEELGNVLQVALATGERGDEALRSMARLHAVDWPGLRIWRRVGGRIARVSGAPLAGEAAVGGWLDSLGALPDRGPVVFGDSLFLGAAARIAGQEAVALTPIAPLVPLLVRVAGAKLVVSGNTERVSLLGSESPAATGGATATAPGDTTELTRARQLVRALGLPDSVVRSPRRGGTRLVVGADTFATSPIGLGILTQGFVLVRGLSYDAPGWARSSFMISGGGRPSQVLSGLFDLSPANPFGYLPVVLLANVAFLFLLIAIWDVVMVTNMGRSITRTIGALRTAAAKLQSGDLEHRIEVRGTDELWGVATAFNTAAEGLARARALEKE
jgi:hypothetical protein